jgi:hypothetical protein
MQGGVGGGTQPPEKRRIALDAAGAGAGAQGHEGAGLQAVHGLDDLLGEALDQGGGHVAAAPGGLGDGGATHGSGADGWGAAVTQLEIEALDGGAPEGGVGVAIQFCCEIKGFARHVLVPEGLEGQQRQGAQAHVVGALVVEVHAIVGQVVLEAVARHDRLPILVLVDVHRQAVLVVGEARGGGHGAALVVVLEPEEVLEGHIAVGPAHHHRPVALGRHRDQVVEGPRIDDGRPPGAQQADVVAQRDLGQGARPQAVDGVDELAREAFDQLGGRVAGLLGHVLDGEGRLPGAQGQGVLGLAGGQAGQKCNESEMFQRPTSISARARRS